MRRTVRFGVFEVDFASAELRRRGRRVKLEAQPFQVLCALVRRPGDLVTRECLQHELWSRDTFVEFDHSLNTAVKKVRRALDDSPRNPRYIETVPRQGYRFIATVESVAARRFEKPPRLGRLIPVLVGVAFLLLAGFGIWTWQHQSPPTTVFPGPVPLTSLRGSESRPAFSPDGTRVAFSWSGEDGDNVDIYVQVVGSGSFMRLTYDPAIDETPSWSPSGSEIAFVRTSSAGQAIYLTSPVGGQERRVTEFSSLLPAGLAWDHDGKSILYSEAESVEEAAGICRFFLQTGDKLRLTSPPPEMFPGDLFPAVSPDGQTLAFARGAWATREVYHMPLEGGEPQQLTSQGGINWGLAWTADSRRIVYAQQSPNGSAHRLWNVSVPGGSSQPVPEAGQDVQFPAVSPDGKRLVFERINSDANIWLYSLRGENTRSSPKELSSTRRDETPRISPDGSRIVFVSDRTGAREIWTCNRDGANLVQLSSLGAAAGSPRWSPDGRRVAFDAAPRGDWDIFVVDAQGGPLRQLTTYEGEDSRPSWSHDNRRIYFASTRSGSSQIWKIPPEGGQPVRVTQGGGRQPFESPDRRFLYFGRAPGAPGVYRVPVNGGDEVAVPGAAMVPPGLWDVASNGIYFVGQKDSSPFDSRWFLRLLPFGAAKAVDVMELPPPIGATPLDIAPDGGSFAYAQRDRVESDLWVLDTRK